MSRLAARVIAQHGVPDIVVSNAGAFLLRTLEGTTAAELEIVSSELDSAMAQLGCAKIDDLHRERLWSGPATASRG